MISIENINISTCSLRRKETLFNINNIKCNIQREAFFNRENNVKYLKGKRESDIKRIIRIILGVVSIL